jgi:hypothetical protein
MEHLLNCHGEWAMALAVLANLPLVGVWVRSRLPAHAPVPVETEGGE